MEVRLLTLPSRSRADIFTEYMPLEECGNMIIMTLAYAQRANDNNYLSQHYDILSQWTGYLVDEALIPANQLSTDDFQGQLANQTNLALKGIIAIEAMAVIAELTGNSADASNYHNIATSYISKWQGLAVVSSASPPHTSLAYNDDYSHGLLYNLYADKLLGLNLVPQSIYDMQSKFYATVSQTYGVPLDTRDMCTKCTCHLYYQPLISHFISQLTYSSRLGDVVRIHCLLINATNVYLQARNLDQRDFDKSRIHRSI